MKELSDFELIKRNTAEIITEEDLKKLIEEKKERTAYVGRATTGPLHIGHLIPLGKIFDFQKANVKVKILLADIHAALDDQKAKWEDLDKRVEYTQKCIELAFDWPKKIEFVRGADFELKHDYVLDMLKLSTVSTVERATRAASEVTRMKNPKVSELIYPIMQALDEEYLNADIQFGGVDQRHIFAYARDYLPKLGYKKRVEIMTPLVAALSGADMKMSSSVPGSIIKVYDSEESIRKKIAGAYCPEGVIENNLIVQIPKFLIFPAEGRMKIERDDRFGGDVEIDSYEHLESLFKDKKLHPTDLKKAVAEYLIRRFYNVRTYFEKHLDLLKELGKEFLP
jgi:tyrosyl-tRNA synthetase